MPIYVYECRSCGKTSEVLIRGNEKPVCPDCGSAELTKQASAFGAVAVSSSAPAAPPCASGCQNAGNCPYSS